MVKSWKCQHKDEDEFSITMDNVPNYISSYFTKWSANIIKREY